MKIFSFVSSICCFAVSVLLLYFSYNLNITVVDAEDVSMFAQFFSTFGRVVLFCFLVGFNIGSVFESLKSIESDVMAFRVISIIILVLSLIVSVMTVIMIKDLITAFN